MVSPRAWVSQTVTTNTATCAAVSSNVATNSCTKCHVTMHSTSTSRRRGAYARATPAFAGITKKTPVPVSFTVTFFQLIPVFGVVSLNEVVTVI